jgi:hypothetical protein
LYISPTQTGVYLLRKSGENVKLNGKLTALYVFFVVSYGLLTFLAPPPRVALTKYHITVTELHLLYLTIVIPVAIIWFLAFYGYAKLQAYNTLITNTDDGDQVTWLSRGLMVLAVGLPVTSLLAGIANLFIQEHPQTTTIAIIVRNYVSMIIPLVAFLLIARGAYGLCQFAKQHPSQLGGYVITALAIIIGTMYCFIVLRYSQPNAYRLPNWLATLTLVAPYVFTWYVGLVAAYNLHLYSRHVTGVVYRKSWDLLAAGIGFTITMSIIVQYVTTLTRQFNFAGLGITLIIIYCLLALLSVGYVLIARGAKKLQRIEEA